MIKINLLPVKEKKRRQQILIGVYVGLVLVFIATVLGWLLTTRYQKKAALEAEIAKIDEESAQYQDKIREIKELEQSQVQLENFRKIAKTIGDEQRKLLGSLDQIASQLPREVWLENVTQGQEGKGDELTIKGYSFSDSMLKEFARNLGRPGGFLSEPSTVIVNNFMALQGGNTVYQFEIRTNMVVPK